METGKSKFENRSWKIEIGNWKLGDQDSKVKSRKSNPKSKI
jgi:hypothetical protein